MRERETKEELAKRRKEMKITNREKEKTKETKGERMPEEQ